MNNLYIESRLQAIKGIANASCVDEKDADNIASFCDEIYDAIPKIDKIVEELEKTMQDLNVIEVLSHIDFDSTIQNGLDNFLKAYNSELLRIVKQGGVSDDTDDVCKWKKYPFTWFAGCDGCEVNHKQGNYCPRCEKKDKGGDDKQVTVTMVGNSEDTAVNLIHKVMNGKL